MGCWYWRIDREEIVSRCKARKRNMKQLVKARQALASSHSMYLRSLRGTGSALLPFSNNETTTPRLYHHHHTPPPPPQQPPFPPPPSMSLGSDTWASTTTASAALPPSPPQSSNWDFWDPFVPATESRLATEEEWEAATVTANPQRSGLQAWRVPLLCKELVEIVKEVDEYFLKASDAGSQLSLLLEVSNPKFPSQSKGYNNGTVLSRSHSSTIERLYAWEKKLYQEVKMEHEKRVVQLRKLELKRAEYLKTEKTKKEIEKLESQMMVASQAIKTISTEIIQLRESELYPQLLDLVKKGRRLMCMWRSMYEIHQVHTHIVQQLKYLNFIPSNEPTSEILRQSTLQLEFEFSKDPLLRNSEESKIYTFCEDWHLVVDRIPDKVASEGIKSFLTVIHTIVVSKQKKKADSTKKRTKVEMWRVKAEEEKNKNEKSVSVTLNDATTDTWFGTLMPCHLESVYNQAKAIGEEHDVKRILP
ncbi:Ascorbate peroxidase isoform 1 [Hibiscus syriacus]|uniref:Ascorbate peroxidase isoform 1 n=1 Tax=Hibiscus syriacus TaxID=106335 RepID=A0A6A2ZZY7_HIBSY|nr:Ascorbate peroxidase isoform 1 [Hibiscus syriacus]